MPRDPDDGGSPEGDVNLAGTSVNFRPRSDETPPLTSHFVDPARFASRLDGALPRANVHKGLIREAWQVAVPIFTCI